MQLLAGVLNKSPRKQLFPDKQCVRALIISAQSDRERECIRYAVFKASGLSSTSVRQKYGFDNMTERAARVEEAMCEAQKIRETFDEIANIQDKALLAHFAMEESG